MANLNEILQQVSILNDNSSTIPAVSDEAYTMRVKLINEKLKWLWNYQNWNHLATEVSTAFTSKQATLPVRQDGVLNVFDGTTEYTPVDYETFKLNGTSGNLYYLDGVTLNVNQDVTPLDVRYIPEFTELVDGTDEVDFPASLVAKLILPQVKISEGADVEDIQFLNTLEKDAQSELADYVSLTNRKKRVFQAKGWA